MFKEYLMSVKGKITLYFALYNLLLMSDVNIGTLMFFKIFIF